MKPFLTYSKERFPLGTYLLLTLGFALSSHLTTSGGVIPGGTIAWKPVIATTLALLLFFFELRLMDERKDLEKDKTVNPERPLARGLIPAATADRWILRLVAIMLGYSFFLGLAFSPASGWAYAFISAYLWLMYREFYIGEKLSEFPLTYAITHQAVLVPIGLLGALAAEGRLGEKTLALAGAMTASFFCYEVCRKLDPRSHPLNKTYLQYHGPVRTAGIVVVLNTIAIACAQEAGVLAACLPFQILLFVSLALPVLRPEKYKITELAATLGLVAHLWAYPALTLYLRMANE